MDSSCALTLGPLAGVRVVDLTSVVSGPAATGVLADQGAEVIKIEPPSGDVMRGRSGVRSPSAAFVSVNRGKRSVVLDLKHPAASEALWRIIEQADVFVQNFRPGVIERLGFGHRRVRARHPRLIYLSISGAGEKGPYAQKRTYDPMIQALSGLADIQADPLTGRPRMVRTLIADKTTAIHAAQAVTAALFARERSGTGQVVHLSMLDTMVAFIWPEGMAPFSSVEDGAHDAPATPHDMVFPTLDGYITVGAVSDKEWRVLCEALERPEWVKDPRFATGAARAANRQERLEAVEATMGKKTSIELLELLGAADVPSAPVLTRREMLEDPQVSANQLVRVIEQPGFGLLRQARPAAQFVGTPSHSPRPAPLLGEHTDAVLESLGYDADTIARLHAQGAIGSRDLTSD